MEAGQQAGLAGLRVVSFESRRAQEMAELIRRYGGEPILAPSMREIPLDQNPAALDFVRRLESGEIDMVILLTGVGTRTLVEAVAQQYPRERLAAALSRTTLIARGPKPVAALKELGLQPAVSVREPNTWRELLSELDLKAPVRAKRVAVQEYGITNQELLDGLKARGAEIIRVAVYRWALPEDTRPLRFAVKEISHQRAEVALFTNATQVDHLLRMAADENVDHELRRAFERVLIGSIGPVCTEALEHYGLRPDLEPDHPKMGHLIATLARRARALLEEKRQGQARIETGRRARPADGEQVFLAACRREKTPHTPVWLMRQAGRYMAEYRRLREQFGFLDLCKRPDLASEITVVAVERLGVDAAILFSDILLVLEPMGVGLEYSKNNGPVIHRPVRSASDVEALGDFEMETALGYVFDAVRRTRAALPNKVPLIGFCGAPFTLASYLIEGGSARNFVRTRQFMRSEPAAWHRLMERLSRLLVRYLTGQIDAGAEAVQIFDSWAGCLAPADYENSVLPYTRATIAGLKPGVPVIHFSTGTAGFLRQIRAAGGDVIGLDWRIDIDQGWQQLGYDIAIQGNLDPAALLSPPVEIRRQVERILCQVAGRPGHIFNLGHGVLPETPVDHVIAMVDAVHELSAR